MRLGLDISQVGFLSWGQYFRCFRLRWRRRRQPKAPSREAGSAQNETKARGHHGSVQGKTTTIHGVRGRRRRRRRGESSVATRAARQELPLPRCPIRETSRTTREQASPFSLSLGFLMTHVCFEADHCLSIHSFDSSSTSRSCGARSSPTCCVFCCA